MPNLEIIQDQENSQDVGLFLKKHSNGNVAVMARKGLSDAEEIEVINGATGEGLARGISDNLGLAKTEDGRFKVT